MMNPDLMLTKAEALRRQEQQRTYGDPFAGSLPHRVYPGRQLPAWLRRVQHSLALQLVAWGEHLQAYDAAPTVLASRRSHSADCFETAK